MGVANSGSMGRGKAFVAVKDRRATEVRAVEPTVAEPLRAKLASKPGVRSRTIALHPAIAALRT